MAAETNARAEIACVRVDLAGELPAENESITVEDLVLRGYAYANPEAGDDEDVDLSRFADWQKGLAQDVINVTAAIDQSLNVYEVSELDEREHPGGYPIPKSLMLSYKTVMYNLMCEAHRAKEKIGFYKFLAALFAGGLLIVTAGQFISTFGR